MALKIIIGKLKKKTKKKAVFCWPKVRREEHSGRGREEFGSSFSLKIFTDIDRLAERLNNTIKKKKS